MTLMSRLSLFCDKLLEAGWLAALIVAPLFFNVYSSRVFEPDKIALVRSIALVMIIAWLVKRIDAGLPAGSLADAARATLQSNPLILPTLAIVVAYIIATIFSVAPNVSFWGSYQRLQGTYSTFSYIVIFLIAAGNLRSRAQFDRAVGVIIATSFPIAFYGVLQHFKLDPLPWGGDTTERVASHMGNSIFVAAYLIMTIPLTLARWIEMQSRLPRPTWLIGVMILAPVILLALWLFNFTLAVGFALVLWLAALMLGLMRGFNVRFTLLTMTYAIVLATQFATIIFSQSRGPLVGLGAGLFVFALLGALIVMRRLPRVWQTWLLGGIIVLAVIAMLFLVVFNLPASPLESLKSVPYVGRLGQILDPNSPTARVRELIWQGALKLFLPHEPLWSPTTGDDAINILRPLVGYGPEAMYVAFNPFYPAELGQLEARNASPDRSHNETFDALVMNGLFGFAASIFLFMAIFYYGLKWLGLIASARERNIFGVLWLAVGLAFALVFGVWRGWHWIGVALPAGMILGFMIFLVGDAWRRYRTSSPMIDARRALWLSALIAAIIAHFVESHFGIAIVSTRTHFWFYAALLVVIGMNHLVESAPAPIAAPRVAPEESPRAPLSRRQRRRLAETQRATTTRTAIEISPAPVVAWTFVATLMFVTLAFEFITNQTGTPSPLEAVQRALLFKDNQPSYGILGLFVLTWAVIGIIGLAERATSETAVYDILLFIILSFTAVLWFVMVQTRFLTTPGDLTESFINLLGLYYLALVICGVIFALALWFDVVPRPAFVFRSGLTLLLAAPLAILGVALIFVTNFNGIRADILYKAGTNYDATGAWDKSIQAYGRAVELQPTQDFYALFLGRAYLEAGRATNDAAQRANYLNLAEQTLLRAQRLNPLNTDHTANLARMQRIVGTMVENPARAEAFRKSSDYYAMATRLSPNTAYLRNEWSLTNLQAGDLESARLQLEKSLTIDPKFAQTYVYFGDYYRAVNDPARAVDNYLKAIQFDPAALTDPDGGLQAGAASVLTQPTFAPRAIQAYRTIAQNNPALLSPHFALAELYQASGQLDLARQEMDQIARLAPNDFLAQLTVVNFYSEQGQIDAAVTAMRRVMNLIAPSRPDYARFSEFYNQLQLLQREIQTVLQSPNDVNARRTLATRWKARGQPQFAVKEYDALVRLVPNDYDAHKNLALLNLQLVRLDDAQRALVAVAALAPENEKPFWQNVQAALNAHKTNQFAEALKAAQAALALASDADKLLMQAYVTLLQDKTLK